MSYYASGKGWITFAGVLDEQTYRKVAGLLEEVLEFDGEREFRVFGSSEPMSYFDLWDNDKYYGDDILRVLEEIAKIAPIKEGELDYKSVDDFLWRFVYRRGEWCEESGEIVYLSTSIPYERLLQICRSYIENDVQNADPSYIREVLVDTCACTNSEIRDLGLEYLIPEE